MKKLINFFKKYTNRNRFVYAQLNQGDKDSWRGELNTGIDDAQKKLKEQSDDASKDIEKSITAAKSAIEASRDKIINEINSKAEKEHGSTGTGGAPSEFASGVGGAPSDSSSGSGEAPSESANADLIAFRNEIETLATEGIADIDKDAGDYRIKHSCIVDFAKVEAKSGAAYDEENGESMSSAWKAEVLPSMTIASLDVKDSAGREAVEEDLAFLTQVNVDSTNLINVLEGRLLEFEDINGRGEGKLPADLQKKITDKIGKLNGFVTKLKANVKKAKELYNQKLKVLQANAADMVKKTQDEIKNKREESAKMQSLREAEKKDGKTFTNTNEELVNAFNAIKKQEELAKEMNHYANALKVRKGLGEGEEAPVEEPAPEPAKPKAPPVAVARAPKKKEEEPAGVIDAAIAEGAEGEEEAPKGEKDVLGRPITPEPAVQAAPEAGVNLTEYNSKVVGLGNREWNSAAELKAAAAQISIPTNADVAGRSLGEVIIDGDTYRIFVPPRNAVRPSKPNEYRPRVVGVSKMSQ